MDNNLITTDKTTNVLAVKEKKGTIKKIWDKIVDHNIKREKLNIKRAPVACKVVSVFVPEAAPVLLSIRKFMKSDSGKKITEFSYKGYDSLGELLKGNREGAKSELKEGLRLFSADEAGNIALDVRNFATELKGMSK